MSNKKLQSYKNPTTQVRIDTGLHQLLKVKAAESGTTIKTLLEEAAGIVLEVKPEEKSDKIK